MKDDRVSAAFSGLVVCGVVVLGILCPRAAQAECSKKAAGAYLTIVKNGESIASRSTLILGADGTSRRLIQAKGRSVLPMPKVRGRAIEKRTWS